jgi:uncharacterized protein YqgV (UPF0045/DUF77 family)
MTSAGAGAGLVVEFTVEPFVEGDPGPHVRAALAAAEDAAARTGLRVEFGPFGTSITGAGRAVLDALDAVVRAAVTAGATRVSLQVSRHDGPGTDADLREQENAVSRLGEPPSPSR